MSCSSGGDTGSDPARVFARLAEVLHAGDEPAHAYRAICLAAPLLVDGCDHAALTIRRGGLPVGAAATDEVASRIDEMEHQIGTGPCVDALTGPSPQLAPDLTLPDGPWPQLRARVLATTPVRGMLGFGIAGPQRRFAALNLFTDRPCGFTRGGIHQVAVLAAFCSVALRAATAEQQAQTLRRALASNREIGQATGLLMAHHKVDETQAYDILRTTSNELNLKLSAVAAQIVRGHLDQLTRPG